MAFLIPENTSEQWTKYQTNPNTIQMASLHTVAAEIAMVMYRY
mgnify:CR=1 FL=1